jgi:hypothetical protein
MKRVLTLFAILLVLLAGVTMDARAFTNVPPVTPGDGTEDPDGDGGGHPWGGDNSYSTLPTKDRTTTSLNVTGFVVVDFIFNYLIYDLNSSAIEPVVLDSRYRDAFNSRIPSKTGYHQGDAVIRREQ